MHGPNLTEYRPGQWSWGALWLAENPGGFCGGVSTLAPGNDSDLPQMVAESPPGTAAPGPAPVWHAPGWPAMVTADRPGVIPELARCGPIITAIAVPRDGRIVLKLWLMDRKLAGPAPISAAPAPELARPKVKS